MILNSSYPLILGVDRRYARRPPDTLLLFGFGFRLDLTSLVSLRYEFNAVATGFADLRDVNLFSPTGKTNASCDEETYSTFLQSHLTLRLVPLRTAIPSMYSISLVRFQSMSSRLGLRVRFT